jgi:hypothetical protein
MYMYPVTREYIAHGHFLKFADTCFVASTVSLRNIQFAIENTGS